MGSRALSARNSCGSSWWHQSGGSLPLAPAQVWGLQAQTLARGRFSPHALTPSPPQLPQEPRPPLHRALHPPRGHGSPWGLLQMASQATGTVRWEPRQTEDWQVAGVRGSHRLVGGHKRSALRLRNSWVCLGVFHFVRPEVGCLCPSCDHEETTGRPEWSTACKRTGFCSSEILWHERPRTRNVLE